MNEPQDLVYIDEYNLLGKNFYWYRHEAYGITKDDLLSVGITNDRLQVSKKIINQLILIDNEIQKRGWKLYFKDAYRSKSLYKIIYERRVAKFGKEKTDAILNINKMQHSSGLSVDVVIWDIATNKEIYLRNGKDEPEAFFIHFYDGKDDIESKKYKELQDYLVGIMLKYGFRLGELKEYWHFDYKPDLPFNY